MSKIYVASSWRNELQPMVVEVLRAYGHEVYDFRNPAPGNTGFAWSEIDPDWQKWSANEYIAALEHPISEAGFKSDFNAMQWCDVIVLVLPCGRSAHLEAGWGCGAGKAVFILTHDGEEPELMAKMATGVFGDLASLIEALHSFESTTVVPREYATSERTKLRAALVDLIQEIESTMDPPKDEYDKTSLDHCLDRAKAIIKGERP